MADEKLSKEQAEALKKRIRERLAGGKGSSKPLAGVAAAEKRMAQKREASAKRTAKLEEAGAAAKKAAAKVGSGVKKAAVATAGAGIAAGAGAIGLLKKGKDKLSFTSYLVLVGIALINYYTDFFIFNHQINEVTLIIDLITFVILAVNFKLKWLAIPLLMETFLIGFLVAQGYFLTFTGILLILPWWLLFLFAHRFATDEKFFTMSVSIMVVLGFIVLSGSGYFLTISSDYLTVQPAVYEAKDAVGDFFVEDVGRPMGAFFCGLLEGVELKPNICRSILAETADEVTLSKLKIVDSLDTSFAMDVPAQFLPEEGGLIIDDKIPLLVTFESNLANEVEMEFSCDFGKKGKGTIEIDGETKNTYTVRNDLSRTSRINVVCAFDREKITGSAQLTFNATAKNVVSSGFRDVHVVNKVFLEGVLRRYEGFDENVIITRSLEFRDYTKGRTDLLNSYVGRNDLVQPVVTAGIIAKLSLQPLLHGVDSKSSFPAALFLKNNGNGFISKMNAINFIMPNDLAFPQGENNCGLTNGKLESIKFDKIKKGDTLPTRVTSCTILTRASSYGTTPEPKPINVELTYDYTISRKRTVLIQ